MQLQFFWKIFNGVFALTDLKKYCHSILTEVIILKWYLTQEQKKETKEKKEKKWKYTKEYLDPSMICLTFQKCEMDWQYVTVIQLWKKTIGLDNFIGSWKKGYMPGRVDQKFYKILKIQRKYFIFFSMTGILIKKESLEITIVKGQ